MLSTKADNDLWRPEGGELKAKQAGVVLPGATQLSLGGGEIGQLLTSASGRAGHTNVGIEGRVAPTGQLDIWIQSFFLFLKVAKIGFLFKPKMITNLQNRFQ